MRLEIFCTFGLLLWASLLPTAASGEARSTLTLRSVVIMDSGPNGLGGEAYRILMPADWRLDGAIVWSKDPANPAAPRIRLIRPRGQEIGVLPPIAFVWNPQMFGRFYPAGSEYANTEVQPPVLEPFQCIQRIIVPRYQRELGSARIILRQELLPELTEVGHMKYPGPEYRNAVFRAGKIRFGYSERGVSMEEHVYVLTAAVQFPVGGTTTTMWSPDEICYSKAPAGELDRQLPLFQTAMFSLRPNLRWFAHMQRVSAALVKQQADASNAALARAQAAAAARHSAADASNARSGDQINDMIMKGYQRRMAVQDAMAAREDRSIRQVEIFKDPRSGEQYELPEGYSSAFRGPDGTFTMGGANDNPNYDSNGAYTRMERVANQ
jgi:hypothetical protein